MKYPLLYLPALFILAVIAGFLAVTPQFTFGGQGGVGANTCSSVTQRAIAIDTASREIVAANARTAWVSIQQPFGATNTVALGFGVTAVASSSYRLATSTPGASVPDRMHLGLNTDFPYTGAVNAIASAASTTIFVTTCIY